MDEISQNFEEFLPNEDLLSQLQAYAHLRNYQSTVVDLMVYGLANVTLTTCAIFSESKGVVNRTIIEPREGKKSSSMIRLCKIGPHYDAVLKLSSTEGKIYDISTFSCWISRFEVKVLTIN